MELKQVGLPIEIKIQKWGGSLAVRIPAALLLLNKFEAGDKLELSTYWDEKGETKLVLQKPQRQAIEKQLETLSLLTSFKQGESTLTDEDIAQMKKARREARG